MKLKDANAHFLFTKEQRLGILVLFSIIVALQLVYHFIDFNSNEKPNPEKEEWLSLQTTIDSLKNNKKEYVIKMYPFNPNFITDFKGYKLGMTVEQIDKLLAFRKLGKFANSPQEFQQVTGISDSLLNAISPFFKFPDWVNKKSSNYENKNSNWVDYSKTNSEKKEVKINVLDINTVTKEDLMKVYGIGDAISDRILKQKEIYGVFVSMEQMNDVWGLSPEVKEKLNQHFKVVNPNPKKININNASIKELSQFPYFRYQLARNIVIYRSMNGDIELDDLSKIKDFPVDKIKIISLYLEF